MRIPFIDLQSMHADLREDLDEVWRQTRLSSSFIGGEAVESFECKWAQYCGTKHCVGVASGTAALELALAGLGIGTGDEVIVPANTFIATAAAVHAVGARAVFVDVDPTTLLITPANLAQAITCRTAAVIVVHLYGQAADMDSINRVASSAGILVIEDAAQAHGATWRGRKAGGLSHAGCFSFYPGKNLGAFGDAGAVVTNDRSLADTIRSLSNHGRSPHNPHRHELLGGTHRLDALQAAILSVKLNHLDAWNARRGKAADAYARALAGLPVELVGTHPHACSCHHLAVVQVAHRSEVRQALAAEQISTGLHYPIPCHRQAPYMTDRLPPLPITERAADRLLSLPMFPHLTETQIRRVADAMFRALSKFEYADASQ